MDRRSDSLIRYTTSQEDFLKNPNAWDRLVTEMRVEGRKSAYEWVLQPGVVKRLSMKNDPMFFLDELTKVFA